ncbi:MAG: M90 family metallopeptidase [Gemmatales bacterium]
MLFDWFKNRRRRRLQQQPWPPDWLMSLQTRVLLGRRLPASFHAKWKNDARILIAEKFWEGCNGLTVTDEMKVVICLQASFLLLGLEPAQHGFFDRVPSILVYPTAFRTAKPDDASDEGFVPDQAAEGQAVYRGPVILAWDEVLDDSLHPEHGHNVVIHEFAHQLDFLDNSVDGVPPLENFRDRGRWKDVMNQAMELHRNRIEHNQRLFFPLAAGESVTEFFAYASEAFYCDSQALKSLHPEVYGLLQAYYRIDPGSWN